MDPAKLKEMASKMTDEQRRELAEKLDTDLEEYMKVFLRDIHYILNFTLKFKLNH